MADPLLGFLRSEEVEKVAGAGVRSPSHAVALVCTVISAISVISRHLTRQEPSLGRTG
ncbi:hypothetical protein [Streptomyces sp. NPDC017991]|uniref:hypothetical protein n=1 Tax=Streptomyces sp. NPDC017991 TaxID=3365026 RepID=UPI003798F531